MSGYLNPIQSSDAALAAKPSRSATAHVAEFIEQTEFSDIPEDVVEKGKIHILDAAGLVLAGLNSETAPIVTAYLNNLGVGKGGASVLGTGRTVPARFAAFANGVSIHAHDFDDTQLAVAKDRAYGLLTHPTVTVFPPALALAETSGASGKDFMLAFQVGIEVETKIAEASGPRSYRSGFHSTGVFGVFGSAAASAKVRGFNEEQIKHTLGVAGAHSSGLIENIGSMTKPFQAGHSAEGGVLATDLVSIGWTASTKILEGRRGFYTAHAGEFDEDVLFDTLGGPWTLNFPGVSIKPYPSGSQMHAAMDAMLNLVVKHDLRPQDVAKVRVGAKQALLNTLTHYRPQDGTQAKFSAQFAMASLLLDRRAGLLEHEDHLVRRPELQALFPKIELYRHPDADAAGDDKLRSYVEIELNDGTVLKGDPLDFARGSPKYPMSFDDVADKALGCAEFAKFPEAQAKKIVEAIRTLENVTDIRSFTALFSVR